MDVFAALADPVRRALVLRLRSGPLRVVDLTGWLADEGSIAGGPSRPAVSRHLRVLGEAGLVAADDRGRERHYRLTQEGLAPVRELLTALTPAPPVPAHLLDGLDLEVRRTVRDGPIGGNVHPTGTDEERTA